MDATATLSRNELVEAHDDLCQKIVKCLFRRKDLSRSLKGLEFDDILQEARYALIQAADSFDPARGAGFITHATNCITNFLRDHLRSVGRKVEIQAADFNELDEQLADAAPDCGMEGVENRLFIQQAMDALPPQQRQAIDLHFLQSMTQAEVAARMNITERHVRRLIADALAAMRRMSDA